MNPGQPNVNLRLDAKDLELLKKLAEREDLSRSDVIRRAIRKVAREAGLLEPKEASVL